MSFNQNRATALAAIIILTAACSMSISAQTPAAVNGLTAQPVDATNLAAGAANQPKFNPRSKVSDSARVNSNTGETAGAADKGREETGRSTTSSPQAAATDSWQFQLTPYLWIPTISGRAGIGNLTTDTAVSVGDSDIELNFGIMATFEARKNKFIILTDLQYSDLATERDNRGPLYSSTRSSFKTFVLDPEVGYRFLDNGKGATLDVLGGVRYWHLNANLAFRAGLLPAVEASRSRSWIDGVVGLRGKAALSQRFFVTGKADLGGGGSKFTYQLFGGLGINVGKSVALVAGYRDLNVNYDKDNFLFDMSLHGPIFGLGFKF